VGMTELFGYRNKRVIVSGCFSGIGRATAKLLLDLGAEVHGLDLKKNDLELHSFTALDLRDRGSIDAAAKKIGGRVDALFNCAGIPPGPPPMDVMKVNFIGTRHLTEQVLPLMKAGGAIANVASNGGAGWSRRISTLLPLVSSESDLHAVRWCEENPRVISDGYRFSKEAIILWTLLSSSRLIKGGIRVNCTSPGVVQTPMLEEIEKVTATAVIDAVAEPIGRRSRPEEQANPLLFLNGDLATYVNGAILAVDGGFMAAQMTRQ
jgi:NAD(P)-dependent dehydrogenase (short-subunit alcohol dehydrogenase family)